MNLGEILSDAFVYPLNNIKALIIYVILGIVAGIAGGAAVFGIIILVSFWGIRTLTK